jgi:hypothetical protein
MALALAARLGKISVHLRTRIYAFLAFLAFFAFLTD